MKRVALAIAAVALLLLIPYACYELIVASPAWPSPTVVTSPTFSADWSPAHAGDTPPGGISRSEAIRLANAAAHPGQGMDTKAYAEQYGRKWFWEVDFEYYGGPTGSEGLRVRLDFFTGQVLNIENWVS